VNAYTEGDDYDMFGRVPTDDPQVYGKTLYDRNKCTTCCRVLLVSDWDYECKCSGSDCIRGTGCSFNDNNYNHEGHTYFVMDIEFNDSSKVKSIVGTDHAQMIPLRPLEANRSLQFWELGAYKMINSYVLPKRNQDTRNGPYPEKYTKLIYWLHQPPLSYLSDAQKFYYVYPYPTSYYPYYEEQWLNSNDIKVRWQRFPKHMYVITSRDGVTELCYQAGVYKYNDVINSNDKNYHEAWEKWTCNKEFTPRTTMYQIQIKVCVNDGMVDRKEVNPIEKTTFRREHVRRQEFTPIFA
jgi:galactose-inhibitable lectin light subunit